ncbi:MAG: hypothetical protein EAY75_13730 [Bacteroidetes bacterium]|nr:MAG: hypothetical protein EAY75_13730 [Bacteroidota bacterium]
MKLLMLCLSLGIGYSTLAQSATKAKWKYANLTSLGLQTGSSDINYSAQTIHGLRKGNRFAGIGIGLDAYGVSGFPVVVHGQQAFGQKRSRPFVYGQAGAQLPWHQGMWNTKLGRMNAYQIETGALAEFGAGYSFRTHKKMQIQVSLGYSYKNSWVGEASYPMFLSIFPPPEGIVEYQRYFYQFQRIALKVGVAF